MLLLLIKLHVSFLHLAAPLEKWYRTADPVWMVSVQVSLMKLLCLRVTSAAGEPSRGRVITTRDHNHEWTQPWPTRD